MRRKFTDFTSNIRNSSDIANDVLQLDLIYVVKKKITKIKCLKIFESYKSER